MCPILQSHRYFPRPLSAGYCSIKLNYSVVFFGIIGFTNDIDSIQVSLKQVRFVGLEQGPGGGGCTMRVNVLGSLHH